MDCTKTCFQCGQLGHVQPDCTSLSQTVAGRDAFLRYQKAWQAEAKLKPKKTKHKSYHFLKFQRWLQTVMEGTICDPFALARKHILLHEERTDSSFHFELKKMAELSHRELFMDIIERTRLRFSGETTRKEHDELWVHALNQAVKAGEPADFSQIEANRVYADNKLIYRTRYLYQLLMDSNPLSVKLREKLLPTLIHVPEHKVKVGLGSESGGGVGGGVRVASLGGGPVSVLCVAAK